MTAARVIPAAQTRPAPATTAPGPLATSAPAPGPEALTASVPAAAPRPTPSADSPAGQIRQVRRDLGELAQAAVALRMALLKADLTAKATTRPAARGPRP